MFGEYCFNTAIRENVAVEKSIGAQVPLILYAPNSQAGRDYRRLVDELLGQPLQRTSPKNPGPSTPSILAPPEGAVMGDEGELRGLAAEDR